MEITPDFTEAVDQLKPGEYAVRIVDSALKTSKNGGVYVNWVLETFGKEEAKWNGRKVYHITMTAGPGAGMLRQFCTAAGYKVDGKFDTSDLHGKELTVVMDVEKDSDNVRVKSVKRYNA